MSETLLADDPSGLTISRYVGPELGLTWKDDPVSADRRRYQITNNAGMLTTLSAAEWEALTAFFREGHCDCYCSNCSGCLDRGAS